MSRRKQARPIRVLEDEDGPPSAVYQPTTITTTTTTTTTPTSTVLDGPGLLPGIPKVLMCQRCQEQFTIVQEYLTHKVECDRKAVKHDDPAHSDPEDMVVSEDDDEEEENGGKKLERIRRHRQDEANNNSVDENSPSLPDENSAALGFPFAPPPAAAGHVTLEALQNTKVAVAQFAATAMANNPDNEAAMQEFAVLQSTLFTLQHQQVLQLQLINQLQSQLQIDRPKTVESPGLSPTSEQEIVKSETPPSPPETEKSRENTPQPIETPVSQPLQPSSSLAERMNEPLALPSLPPQIQPPMCSISSSLASSIITHNNDPPSLDEPNTLEMLQKRAQEVLDNASQGLLATNLADELAFRKSKGSLSPYDSKGRNEPFFKHRCRYCGKVFGSDSALQIHIRSHTGERPYKCNVCGSRFTTKGNLKVHFQRHSAKFPHIKMNPNPVPEHLDKYHPPLLAQLGQQPALSPGPPTHPPHMGFSGAHPFPPTTLPIYRPPIPPPEMINANRLLPSPQRPQDPHRLFPPHPLFLKREEQDIPENLSKPPRSPTPSPPQNLSNLENRSEIKDDNEIQNEKMLDFTAKKEPSEIENDSEQQDMPFSSPNPYDECSMDSKYSNEDIRQPRSPEDENNENLQDEPENLSNRSCNSISIPLSISTGQRLPANFSFGQGSSPPSSTSSGSLGHFPTTPLADITKDPSIYTNLLPRPGSNDNSWESLIEVTKTSETSKLQQLVDNIEHKLSDPNQCVICHRVLSCKSALQMHYRTHTGERPFRCKICGRAFTTKGNLKTHMGVHRAKPPMRVLHQCPVCHKKFTNALVLQQHIRLHTGEPTDLTPEQIQAAEVKDFPSPGGFPNLPNSIHPFLGQGFPGLSPLGPGHMPLNMKFDMKDREGRSEHESMDDDDFDDDDMSNFDQNMSQFSSPPPSDLQNQISNLQQPNNIMPSNLSSGLSCSAEDLCSNRTTPLQNGEKSPSHSGIHSPGSMDVRTSPNHRTSNTPVHQVPRPPSSQQAASPTPSECNSLGALDLTPRTNQPLITSPGPSPGPPPSIFSAFGLLPPGQNSTPLMSSALSSLTSSVLTSTAFSPLRLAVGPPGRGNTTCNLCFKTFACHSALEIHYRSHTKERPFKCTVCDRGFSTKGNMKQHMLTHKIRDMPQHMFENKPPQMVKEESLPASPQIIPPREAPPPPPPPPPPPVKQEQPPISEQIEPPQPPVKREPSESELPLPKRPPSLQSNKHLCQVCNKNFSSSSALQIHMRTHTGDKPFRCNVCQKAFTTKGNLKVHMGTHMWSNGASRRGRRMSLDLPPIPMTPKDSEFLQRRPDLFYPYLPAPFLNGIQKMNDMSVAQNQNGLNLVGKYNSLLNFSYPPPEPIRSHNGSPDRGVERPPSREGPEPRGLWDLHFERKTSSEGSREDLLPASREGLAA